MTLADDIEGFLHEGVAVRLRQLDDGTYEARASWPAETVHAGTVTDAVATLARLVHSQLAAVEARERMLDRALGGHE